MPEDRIVEENTDEEKQPPKKRAKKITKKKKEVQQSNEIIEKSDSSEDKIRKTKPRAGKKRIGFDHPTTIDMIIEAIENLEESNGSSVQAIKSYISMNYKVRDDMIKSMVKRALMKGLADNLIVRPKTQVQKAQILSGRYLIRPKTAEEIEPPKPRLSKLRQLSVLKSQKSKSRTKGKKKKKRKGFH